MSRLDAKPGAQENQDRLAKIEHNAGLLYKYSGWETCEHPEKEHMAYGLVESDIPWLVEKMRDLHEENERQLDRIRELGFMREEAVKVLEWMLGEINQGNTAYLDDRKIEWIRSTHAVLRGRST